MKKISDERIILQRMKIQSDAFTLLVYFLAISIVVQQFLLRAPFSEFAVEFFSLIGMGIYVSIRHLSIGVGFIDSRTTSLKKLIFNSLFSGFLSVVFFRILAGERNGIRLAVFFMAVAVLFFGSHVVFHGLLKKKNKEIDDELNDEE